MANEQPQLDDLQDDTFDDDLIGNDVMDDFQSVKGMISGALGSLGYKLLIFVLALFYYTYTAHSAFARRTRSEISVTSLNDCSCDPHDRDFYRHTVYGFTAFWMLLLLICGVYNMIINICNCCTGNHDAGVGNGNNNALQEIRFQTSTSGF